MNPNWAFFRPPYTLFNRPFVAHLQPQQPTPHSVIQGLREALYSAITEIKTLKEENKALKEHIELLENKEEEVSQLKEEVKIKDDLFREVTTKRQARSKAHVDVFDPLAREEKEQQRSEEQEKKRCDVLEAQDPKLQKLTINMNQQLQEDKTAKAEQVDMKEEEKEHDQHTMEKEEKGSTQT